MNQSQLDPPRDIAVASRPLLWLNLVCLDAPLVALIWQRFFAENFHFVLPIGSGPVLFLTAWLIYLIDRFADSMSLPTRSAKTLREMFCLLHKNIWVGMILIAASLDAVLIFARLDRSVFLAGIFLATIATVYLTINFAFSKLWKVIPAKEITIGFLFAAGTLVAFWPQLFDAGLSATRSAVQMAAILFACLCSVNCMSIAVWERDLDRTQGKHSIATRWPFVGLAIRILCLLIAAVSLSFGAWQPTLWVFAGCLALSAIFLRAVHFVPLPLDERTALADLVLFPPLAWLLFERIT